MDKAQEQAIETAALSAKHTRENRVDAVVAILATAKTSKTAEVNFLLHNCKRAIKQLHKYELMVTPPDYATTLGLQFDTAATYLEELTAPKPTAPAE